MNWETLDVRETTNRVLDYGEETGGWEAIAKMCLGWLSERDVDTMIRRNDWMFLVDQGGE